MLLNAQLDEDMAFASIIQTDRIYILHNVNFTMK